MLRYESRPTEARTSGTENPVSCKLCGLRESVCDFVDCRRDVVDVVFVHVFVNAADDDGSQALDCAGDEFWTVMVLTADIGTVERELAIAVGASFRQEVATHIDWIFDVMGSHRDTFGGDSLAKFIGVVPGDVEDIVPPRDLTVRWQWDRLNAGGIGNQFGE